jgi:hypothetical protein
MKRAAAVALLLCAACKQQDPAIMLTIIGPFLVPQNGDHLRVEVFSDPGSEPITGNEWCAAAATGCDLKTPLPPGPLNETLTIVESGAAHDKIHIVATLLLGSVTVGSGDLFTTFGGNQTIFLPLEVTRVP